MIKAYYISSIKNKNGDNIGYKIKDLRGKEYEIKTESLKQVIHQGKIHVIGLEIDKHDNLISIEEKYRNLVLRLKLFGITNNEIPTYCGHKCYIFSNNKTHTIYIPPDVTALNKYLSNLVFTNYLCNLQGTIRIVGGRGLKDANYMFWFCTAKNIDLYNFDASNIKSMEGMFKSCKTKDINMGDLDTSNVTNMKDMFTNCEIKDLNLSGFNTRNVINMERMFYHCGAENIDLSSFDTSSVKTMRQMFDCCEAQSLDLSTFDTSNVTDMEYMFTGCASRDISLCSFNTHNVTHMTGMFYCSKVEVLNLNNFDTHNVTDMELMFCGCKAQSIDLSSFYINKGCNIQDAFRQCQSVVKTTDPKLIKELERSRLN